MPRVLLHVDEDAEVEAVARRLEERGARVEQLMRTARVVVADVPVEALPALRAIPGVATVEVEGTIEVDASDADLP